MIPFISVWLLIAVHGFPQKGTSINTQEAVQIGGIKQWITIRGDDRSRPVLLFLHGGPGNSVMGYAGKFTGDLQKHFVVVQWDQRESGKTAELNPWDKPVTVALMEDDAVGMINYLRSRFSKDKIFLMGHSWGGFLGLVVAAKHPELLHAYLAISPMIHQVESERLSLEWMIDKAKTENDQNALTELVRIHIPFASGEDLYLHRSWLAKMMGNSFPSHGFVEEWAQKWLPLFAEASNINFFQFAPEIDCPVYFFVGTKDYQTHFRLTEDYFKTLKSPKKDFFSFEGIGHNVPTGAPKKLQEIILQKILPEFETSLSGK